MQSPPAKTLGWEVDCKKSFTLKYPLSSSRSDFALTSWGSAPVAQIVTVLGILEPSLSSTWSAAIFLAFAL
jgi:hypothetical protein